MIQGCPVSKVDNHVAFPIGLLHSKAFQTPGHDGLEDHRFPCVHFFLKFSLKGILLLRLEREKGKDREGETLMCKRETWIACLLYMPQPGIEPTT